jgi:uncharacterized protein YjaZ
MNFNVIDTADIYRRVIAADDPAEKADIYLTELLQPFAPMYQRFGIAVDGDRDALNNSLAMWGMLTDQTLTESGLEPIQRLEAANAWKRTEAAMQRSIAAFATSPTEIPLDNVQVAIVLSDPAKEQPDSRGYSGFGAMPGYIMPVFSDPNAYNLARVEPLLAHEFHHNARFAVTPWESPDVSVGRYIIDEGLAESFATELYGEDLLGFMVEDRTEVEIEGARSVIGAALDVTGFNVTRSYIFGDKIAERMGMQPVGVPPFGGYAIGYHVVQQYLKRTGKSVVESTFLSHEEIIEESGYFA